MAKNPTIGEVAVYPAQGGLETISIPGTTTVGRLADGVNFIVDINGAKKKHPGCVRYDDASKNLAPVGYAKGLFDHWRLSGTNKVRKTVLVSSGKVWADNSDGNFIDIDPTGAFSIIPYNNVFLSAFVGLLILSFENNLAGGPLKYDQSTLSLLANAPNAKFSRKWMSRLWWAGIVGNPDQVIASIPDNPEDYSVLNGGFRTTLDQGDQDPVGVTALFPPYYNRMVVAKRRGLQELYPSGLTFGVRTLIEDSLGCVSHNSAQSLDKDVTFASERGVHSLAITEKLGAIENSFLSYPIQNYYQRNINLERAENMRAIYSSDLNHYLLAATTTASLTNDVVLGFNFQKNEWDKWDENVSALTKFVDTQDNFKTKILVCDDLGRVGILDTNDVNRTVTWFGERRTMRFTTGIIYPLGVNREVTFRSLRVFGRPQTTASKIDVTYLVNGKIVADLEFDMSQAERSVIGTAVIGTDKIGTQGAIKEVTRELKGVGSAIEIVMTHTPQSDADDCELYGFIIEYEYSGETQLPKQQ